MRKTGTVPGIATALILCVAGVILPREGAHTATAHVANPLFLRGPARQVSIRLPKDASPTATGTQLLDGVVMQSSKTRLSAQLSDGSQRDFHPGPDAKVTRNNRPATLDQLQPGDGLTVTLDGRGNVVEVDAAGPETSGATGTPTAGSAQATRSSGTTVQTETPAATETEAAATPTAQGAFSLPAAAASPAGGERLLDGVVTVANNVGVSVQLSDGTQRDFNPGPDTRVTRNNRVTTLDALQPGDAVTATLDPGGNLVAIDASGPESAGSAGSASTGASATLLAIWGGGIAIQNSDLSGIHNYRLAPDLKVSRDGKTATASDLQDGDDIALTLDGDGRVSEIDATSTANSNAGNSGTAPEVSQAASAGIIGLFVIAVLALGGMLYRRRPASSTLDAAASNRGS